MDMKPITPGVPDCSSIANPPFPRTIVEAWGVWEERDLAPPKRSRVAKGKDMVSEEECLLGYLRDQWIRSQLCQTYLIVPPSPNPAFHKRSNVKDIIIYGINACASTPQRCVEGWRLSFSKKKLSRKRRRGGLKTLVDSRISKGSLDKKLITPGIPNCSSFTNLAFQ
ncbi:uncharacterized protein G2W53_040132 [Senna tora]|uniref:Uncharacterized protein n=1 Tax=Senna tora TaxID=362788 RepID=A0A834SR43_9FABA|nr:uncharacterized protein G2W53_040132 [Senna tora]